MKWNNKNGFLNRLALSLSIAFLGVMLVIASLKNNDISVAQAQVNREGISTCTDETEFVLQENVAYVEATPLPSEIALFDVDYEKNASYQKVIADGVRINLTKKPLQACDNMAKLEVKLKYFNSESLAEYFWKEDYTNLSKEIINEDIISFSSPNGNSLTVAQYKTEPYEMSEFIYSTPAYEAITSALSFGDELTDDSNYLSSNIDLDFMSREEAGKRAMDIADELSISVTSEPRVITLDANTLNETVNQLRKSSYWDILKSSSRKRFSKKWTKEDEGYIIILQPTVMKMPVSYYANISREFTVPADSSLLIMITRNGLAAVKAHSIYRLVNKLDMRDVIAFDEAIAALTNHYSQFVILNEIEIMRANLELVLSRGTHNALVLTPMWVFAHGDTVLNGGTNKNYNERTVDDAFWIKNVFVDAFTGKVYEF